MTKNQFRKTFAPLLKGLQEDDREETVEVYDGLTPKRKELIDRRLRSVEVFRNAFRSEIGSSASVTARFVGEKRTGQRLMLDVSGDHGDDHPFKVDEAVEKAASKTRLKDDFHILGTGGGCGDWARQIDFGEGRG